LSGVPPHRTVLVISRILLSLDAGLVHRLL